jgi:hypothetical protein
MSRTVADLDLPAPAISEIAGSPRTASRLRAFPPPSSLRYFPENTSAAPWNERSPRELQLWFPNNLADNKALHKGAIERIRLEPL